MFSDEEMRTKGQIVKLVEEWANFSWESLRTDGAFDFGNPDYIGRSIPLWKRAATSGILRQQSVNVFMHRSNFEVIGLLYQLRARVECRRIYEEEVKATGWFE